ncbi:hypothetical protein ACTQ5R_06180 [Ruoffia tabacinasalis]|uniref:hypothetical protein n=1 Tax=Ruoffia tabacinasalis TaxID=87458 RepID=UPI003F9560D7
MKFYEFLYDSLDNEIIDALSNIIQKKYLTNQPKLEIKSKISSFKDTLKQENVDNDSLILITSTDNHDVIIHIVDSNSNKELITNENLNINKILQANYNGKEISQESLANFLWKLNCHEWKSKQIKINIPNNINLDGIKGPMENTNKFNSYFETIEKMVNNLPVLNIPIPSIDQNLIDAANEINSTYDRYYNKINSNLIESFNLIADTFNKQAVAIDSILNSVTSMIGNMDFSTFIKDFTEEDKIIISNYFKFDWYIPVTLIHEILPLYTPETLQETDEIFMEILGYFKENNGIELYDLIPRTPKTYYELSEIEILMQLQLFKQVVMYCLERIEDIIIKSQISENSEIKFNNLKTGEKGLDKYIKQLTPIMENQDYYVKELFSNLSTPDKTNNTNLFKDFDAGKRYQVEHGKVPLNRNLFFHGLIHSEEVDEVIATKAILAYGFFYSLFIMKNKNKRKFRRGFSTMRGYKMKSKHHVQKQEYKQHALMIRKIRKK